VFVSLPAKAADNFQVHFPDKSVGMVQLRRQHVDYFRSKDLKIYPAAGTISVPDGEEVIFTPNALLFSHPELISEISADKIKHLRVRFTTMEDADVSRNSAMLRRLAKFPNLETVDLDRCDISDVDAAVFSNLQHLKSLSCASTMITGACLEPYSRCKTLETLKLAHNRLDTKFLKQLQYFPKLKELAIDDCGINSEGIAYISKCSRLIILDLTGNRDIRDSDVASLSSIKSLKQICLDRTNVSSKKIVELARKLPNTSVTTPGRNTTYTTQQKEAFRKQGNIIFKSQKRPPKSKTQDVEFLLAPTIRK